MKLEKIDTKNKFKSNFDTETGFYTRTGVLDDSGRDTGIDPFMASFPELIDIGIMGHCIHGLSGKCKESGVQCYQHGDISNKANMSLSDYKRIIDECRGKTYQVALGGCGDPDQHENFEEILRYTRENNIVPNFTTSGFGLTEEKVRLCKQYCGAVAVSWYGAKYTNSAISMLINAGVTTNIHYVLGKSSIGDAISRLKSNDFPSGINAIIFLLHKPVGLGKDDNVLDKADPMVKEFFDLIDTKKFDFQIGFDSCTIPGLLSFTKNIDPNSIDTCEAARWSMYITPDMYALPCSFDNQDMRYAVKLEQSDINCIEHAWESTEFNEIREKFKQRCPGCAKRQMCLGGCPLISQINLCNIK